jgi:glyoxylase-like metal-dependent hydrolase (beta-lactamase superfamily II)
MADDAARPAASCGEASSYRIGEATITKIAHSHIVVPAAALLPDWDPGAASADLDWLVPTHMDKDRWHLTLSQHAWLVRSAGAVVLIDGGSGARASGAPVACESSLLPCLAAAGIYPHDVTHILLTHLHVDSGVWHTACHGERSAAQFPSARYLIPRASRDLFDGEAGRAHPDYALYAARVLPVIQAGRVEFVGRMGGPVLPGFTYHPTPGHSADHMSIMFRAGGERAFFGGHVLHHPMQLRRPAWSSAYCAAPDQAALSRQWALDYAASQPTLFLSSHFAGSSAGLIDYARTGYRWRPL